MIKNNIDLMNDKKQYCKTTNIMGICINIIKKLFIVFKLKISLEMINLYTNPWILLLKNYSLFLDLKII